MEHEIKSYHYLIKKGLLYTAQLLFLLDRTPTHKYDVLLKNLGVGSSGGGGASTFTGDGAEMTPGRGVISFS